MAAGKQPRGKKKWFTVVAPALFNSRELADITAYSPEELQGRSVEVSGQMLTGLPKDGNRKYLLKIVEAKGEKVGTAPSEYYMTESFMQRSARKYKDRFIYVMRAKTKDDKQVCIKWFFFNTKKLHRSVRGEMLRQTKTFTESAIKEYDSVKVFDPSVLDKMSMDLKKHLNPVHPVDKIFVYKFFLA